jgi:hypothetical protein
MRGGGLLSQKRMSSPPLEAPMVVFVPSNKYYHWMRALSVGGTCLHHRRPVRPRFRRDMAKTLVVRRLALPHHRSVRVRTSYNLGTRSFIHLPHSVHRLRIVHTPRSMAANHHISAQLSLSEPQDEEDEPILAVHVWAATAL